MPAQQLTIAYVGNFTKPWCTEVHVSASLEAIGHRVLRLQENALRWGDLPRIVQRDGVHMLIWQRTWEVDTAAALAALDELRSLGVRSVAYHLDRWWGLAREYQLTSEPFFRCDLVVSPDGGNDERWPEVGITHLWLPPGVFADECVPATPNRRMFPHDVVFVGTHPYPHAEWQHYRERLLTQMQQHFGARFGIYPTHRHRPVRGRQLAALYASAKVVVGDSCMSGGASAYWSDRVPETLGRGGLLVHPHDDRLAEWYPDLPTYPLGDFDAAVQKVEELLSMADSDRLRLAELNRSLVLGRDTYAHRMTTVISEVERRWGFPNMRRSQQRRRDSTAINARHAFYTRVTASFDLRDNDGDDARVVSEVWTDDTYELRKEHVLDGIVLDIGGNIGAFSVLAARLGAKHVHAWEPHPANVEAFAANVERNAVAECVSLHAAALGAKSGTAVLSGVGSASTTSDDEADGHEVAVEAMNDVLAAFDRVALCKIDCEGAEYELIDALDVELLLRVDRLVMEFHGPGMPHLRHLNDDGEHLRRWGDCVTKLAQYGRIELLGRPSVGGVLTWRRF